jgi:hypothetical protein
MDINFVQQVAVPQNFSAPTQGTKKASTTVLPKQATVQPPEKPQEQSQLTPDRDAKRQAMVQQAAKMFKDFFPVSDMSFTIFKDSSGQFVTRFTSLRDGKVTYIPEQNMFTYLGRSGSQFGTNIEIEA